MTSIGECLNREDLFAYSHHLLVPAAERDTREHVEKCVVCRAVVAEYQVVDALLDEWSAVEPSAWFDARVGSAAAAAPPAPGWTLFGFRWPQWVATACLVFLVTAASLIISRRQPSTIQPVAAKSAAAKADEELTLYKDLPVLEDQDYEMIANFDVLSALPRGDSGENKVEN